MFGMITKAAHQKALERAKREAFADGQADGFAMARDPSNAGLDYPSAIRNRQINMLKKAVAAKSEALKKNLTAPNEMVAHTNRRKKSPTNQGVASAAPGKVA